MRKYVTQYLEGDVDGTTGIWLDTLSEDVNDNVDQPYEDLHCNEDNDWVLTVLTKDDCFNFATYNSMGVVI